MDYFGNYGEVNQVIVMRDKFSKKSRCFGFVVFVNESTVDKVMEKGDNHFLHGKIFECKVAIPKEVINKKKSEELLSIEESNYSNNNMFVSNNNTSIKSSINNSNGTNNNKIISENSDFPISCSTSRRTSNQSEYNSSNNNENSYYNTCSLLNSNLNASTQSSNKNKIELSNFNNGFLLEDSKSTANTKATLEDYNSEVDNHSSFNNFQNYQNKKLIKLSKFQSSHDSYFDSDKNINTGYDIIECPKNNEYELEYNHINFHSSFTNSNIKNEVHTNVVTNSNSNAFNNNPNNSANYFSLQRNSYYQFKLKSNGGESINSLVSKEMKWMQDIKFPDYMKRFSISQP